MAQSFGIVEEKVFEADFFLKKLKSSSSTQIESKYYFSAFVSASRSITFSLQATLNSCDGFLDWYKLEQNRLKTDALAPLFIGIRNDIVHKGVNILNEVPVEHLHEHLVNQLNGNRKVNTIILAQSGTTALNDAALVCENYFLSLIQLIYDCYDKFKYTVDPCWYFTKENFSQHNKSIKDALAEMGFPETWFSAMPDWSESKAWKVLRKQQPTCSLNELFHSHLGKVINNPDE